MSDATERLLDAWSSLVADAFAATLGACAAVKQGYQRKRASVQKGTGAHVGACEPAYVAPGKVRVQGGTYAVGVKLGVSVDRLVPGDAQLRHPAPVAGPTAVATAAGTVEIDIGAGATAGMYVGRVLDAAGAPGPPFVIYIDGLATP